MTQGARWTIDFRGTENFGNDRSGYLESARRRLPKHRQHHDVESLVRNVEAIAAKSKRCVLNIVGHGQPGIIGAGSGDTLSGGGLLLDADMARGFVTLRKQFDAIVLWGCEVGAGSEGLKLLVNLAHATGAMCMAPTGLVYCCADAGFRLPELSRWQVVLPFGDPPAEIPLQKYITDGVCSDPWQLKGGDGCVLKREDVACVRIGKTRDAKCVPPCGNELLNALDIARPIAETCALGAFVTGYLSIEFKGGFTSTFRILNERVIEDEATQSSYAVTHLLATLAGR